MQDRIKAAENYLGRVFYHKDFEDPKKTPELLKTISLNSKTFGSSCYEASLLSSEQEVHLFRKMNYLKYKAKNLLKKEKITAKVLEKIESLIGESKEIRNQIAEANFRLAAQLLKQNISFYQKNSLTDSLLSDGYFNVLKAVDYFDWTLGNKFSTYGTWVIKKNFFRDSKEKQKKAEKLVEIKESMAKEARSNGIEEEKEYEGQKKLVQSLITILKHGDCPGNQDRYAFILENYFGLNGKDNCTLEEISKELNITKERVRQLKEKALNWLKLKVEEMNLNYDSCIENFL
jgi:RNA polymerase sigma factor (sigma-70 family)